MTNNPTIDGVSRELLERLVRFAGGKAREELMSILDTPSNDLREHCKQCAEVVKTWPEWKQNCLDGAPAVERQEASVNWQAVATEQMDIIEQRQSTIAQLQARVQELESGRGDPVAWHSWSVGDTVRYLGSGAEHEDCHCRMTIGSDYLIHEAPDEFESMLVLDDDGDELGVLVGEFEFIARDGYSFTAPPAPVAVMMPTTEQFKDAFRATGYVTHEQAWELAEAAKACLDATAALNEVKK